MLFVGNFELGTHFDNFGITHFTFGGQEHNVEPRSWQQYRALILAPQYINQFVGL
jgi:hypothetical protein